MTTIIIAGAVALVIGFGGAILGVLGTTALLQNYGLLPMRAHDPDADLAADIEDPELENDPEEDRLDLVTIRDLLVAATIVVAFNGGDDANLRHALGELRGAADAAHDRFDELIMDLGDGAEAAEAAV